jgi:predicted permease
VMPDSFTFLDRGIRVWMPLAFKPEARAESERFSQNHEGIGRLAPGATVAQAQQQVDALIQRDIERAGELKSLLVNAHYSAVVKPLGPDLVRDVRSTLQVLWGGVLFVLLIAAANVTNLVLVRASSRMKELATRHALGASRGRIARQLMTESLLLTIAGGLLGLAIGQWGLGWLSSLSSLDLGKLPRGYEIHMDWVVVAFTFGLAIVQGLLIGILPIAQLSSLHASLREDGRTGSAGRRGRIVRRGLVTVQVALAFVLLIGAGLLFASFQRLLAVDPGFHAEHVLTGIAGLPNARYHDDAERVSAVQRALERVRAVPGVAAAGVTSSLPFAYGTSSGALFAEGYVMQPGESIISPNSLRVTPGYFEALGVPLKRGRYFSDSDIAGAPRAIIIDERLARHFWPNADPIGRRMYQPENASEVTVGPHTKWLTVVGVVGAMKQQALIEDKGAQLGAYYLPFAQSPDSQAGFVIKTTGDPVSATNAIQRTLATVDPELKLGDVKVMPERIEQSLHARRTPMMLSLGFGMIALLLASIGIYGVLAYQVSQRTREIGIRMALGSNAAGVLRLILREGALLVCVGLAVGLIGAVALRDVIASQLFGVGVLDPVVLVSVCAVLVIAALLACVVPARRASRVDPVVALAQQ